MKTYSIIFSAVSLLSLSGTTRCSEHLEDIHNQMDSPQHSVLVDDSGEFHYFQDGQVHRVDRVWVDPLLKKIKTQEQADAFNKACWIRAVKMSDDNYKLIASGRGRGGGILSAITIPWTIRGIGYVVYPILCVFNPSMRGEQQKREFRAAVEETATSVQNSILEQPAMWGRLG